MPAGEEGVVIGDQRSAPDAHGRKIKKR